MHVWASLLRAQRQESQGRETRGARTWGVERLLLALWRPDDTARARLRGKMLKEMEAEMTATGKSPGCQTKYGRHNQSRCRARDQTNQFYRVQKFARDGGGVKVNGI
jgi:hypothetical protein